MVGRDGGVRQADGPIDIVVERWGEVPYDEALARQLELHARRLAGTAPDTLVLGSHPATFTLGRQAPDADIVLDRAELDRRGIAVARSDRGGRATYHGPGQVVLYPIVAIAELGLGVKDWVCLLEGALIDTLADYGIEGHRQPGTAGIWTTTSAGEAGKPRDEHNVAGNATSGEPARPEQAKIASLGLRIARGVSYHGVALNTGLDASVFDCIVTCGVRGERVTTIERAIGKRPDDSEVGEKLASHVIRRLRDARSRTHATGSCEAPSASSK
jgi:lipoyl(octanoyl) transferase